MLTTVSREVTGPEGERRKKVGHYVLGPCLGEGSFAKVRLGTHIISREKVAVKIVSKRVIIQRETARRNFRREALLLQHVNHPNIVKLYEAMETPNSYYLVFELVENGNLLQYITDRGSLPEGDARFFMRQIVSAVDHLHRSGIVHRDLKLENFLLSAALDIKLVDFGLSALCQREGTLNTQCGSPVYAAPEIFGSRRYGPPVDMWSVGVCLYGMVVGRLPFLADPPTNLPQLHALILRGATIPTFLSQGLQQLLSGLLEVTESKRLSVNDLIHQPWLTSNGSHPVARHPPVAKAPPPSVDTSVVRYMTTMFRFSESDVIQSVTERKLNASSATYHLLKHHLERQRISESCSNASGSEVNTETENAENSSSDIQSSIPTSSRSEIANQSLRINTDEGARAVSQYSSVSEPNKDSENSENNGRSDVKGDAKETRNYKQCILYLKQARNNMFLNGRALAQLQRDAVVGSVSASFEQERSSMTHKLPLLNPNRTLYSSSQVIATSQSGTSQLHQSSDVTNLRKLAGSQLPQVGDVTRQNDVTRHLIPVSLSQDVRLNVCGKSALKGQGQVQTGRHGDPSGRDSMPTSTSAANVNSLFPFNSVLPPPAPPNTAHGSRPPRDQGSGLGYNGNGDHVTASGLKDPFGRDTWRTVYQQEVRVAGESEPRRQRSPGMSFVAPLSSPKTLTTRQPTGFGAEKKQSYFLVRRLAADLNRKRPVPQDNNQRSPIRVADVPHHLHISDTDDNNSNGNISTTNYHVDEDYIDRTNDAVDETRPSTTDNPYTDRETFLTPVIRVTITSTFKGS